MSLLANDSARTARARAAGQRWAVWACASLTWGARVVTFGRANTDHCTYVLDKTVRPNSPEIWDWSTGRIRTAPVSEVQVVEGRRRRSAARLDLSFDISRFLRHRMPEDSC